MESLRHQCNSLLIIAGICHPKRLPLLLPGHLLDSKPSGYIRHCSASDQLLHFRLDICKLYETKHYCVIFGRCRLLQMHLGPAAAKSLGRVDMSSTAEQRPRPKLDQTAETRPHLGLGSAESASPLVIVLVSSRWGWGPCVWADPCTLAHQTSKRDLQCKSYVLMVVLG